MAHDDSAWTKTHSYVCNKHESSQTIFAHGPSMVAVLQGQTHGQAAFVKGSWLTPVLRSLQANTRYNIQVPGNPCTNLNQSSSTKYLQQNSQAQRICFVSIPEYISSRPPNHKAPEIYSPPNVSQADTDNTEGLLSL